MSTDHVAFGLLPSHIQWEGIGARKEGIHFFKALTLNVCFRGNASRHFHGVSPGK